MKRFAFPALLAAAWLGLGGCAPKNPFPESDAGISSYVAVPFVPPRTERCASTALEMVSGYWGSVSSYRPLLTPPELDSRTHIPAKGGTLQIELVATARADGLVAYPLDPGLKPLLQELEAGNPVIVLVNRGYAWYPLWHYVVVTGYDAAHRSFSTHFAEVADERIDGGTFAALWERSGRWGIVPVPPGQVPAGANPKGWLRAVYDLETTGNPKAALAGYEAGVRRWPEEVAMRFALANAQYKEGRRAEAEQNYRKIVAADPSHLYARNNLAELLCRSGRSEEALSLLEGVRGSDAKRRELIEATRREIRAGCPLEGRRP